MNTPQNLENRSPGNLSDELPEVATGDADLSVSRAKVAFPEWRSLSLEERKAALRACRERLAARQEELAKLISREMGKPLRESRLELGAVLAKFDLTFADADRFAAEQPVEDGPHPALVRRRAARCRRGDRAFQFSHPFGTRRGAGLLAGGEYGCVQAVASDGECRRRSMRAEMQARFLPGVFELVAGLGRDRPQSPPAP